MRHTRYISVTGVQTFVPSRRRHTRYISVTGVQTCALPIYWSCTWKAAPLPAWAYQTHWVNKHIGVLDPEAPIPALMSPLNAPDSPTWTDCQLGVRRSEP